MLTKEELPPCPVATCFQLFGNKWKIYIIQQLQKAIDYIDWKQSYYDRLLSGEETPSSSFTH